jgi:hypothetical protein
MAMGILIDRLAADEAAARAEFAERFARLAAANGGKTRAIIKLLGRGAIVIAVSALELANWVLWAAFLLLGFASSCKAATERATLSYIRWRKARAIQSA